LLKGFQRLYTSSFLSDGKLRDVLKRAASFAQLVFGADAFAGSFEISAANAELRKWKNVSASIPVALPFYLLPLRESAETWFLLLRQV